MTYDAFLASIGITQSFELSSYSSDKLWMWWLTFVHLFLFLYMCFMFWLKLSAFFCWWPLWTQLMTCGAFLLSMWDH